MHIYTRIHCAYRRKIQAFEDFMDDNRNNIPWSGAALKLLRIVERLINICGRILSESLLWELFAPLFGILLLPLIKPFFPMTILQQVFVILLVQFVAVLQLTTCSFHLTSTQSEMDYFPGFFLQLSIPYGNKHLMHNRLLRGNFRAIGVHFIHLISASFLTNVVLPSLGFCSPVNAAIIATILFCCVSFSLRWSTVTRIFRSLYRRHSSALPKRVFIDKERSMNLKESRRPSYYQRDILHTIFLLFGVIAILLMFCIYLSMMGQCFESNSRTDGFCLHMFSQFFSLIFHFCAEAMLVLEIIIDQLTLKERFVAYHYFRGRSKDRWHILVCLRSNENGDFLKDLSYVAFAMKGARWKERIKKYVKEDEQNYRFKAWGELPGWILAAIERDNAISSRPSIPHMAC